MCKIITIHNKYCVEVCVNDAEYHQCEYYSPRMTQTRRFFWHGTHVWMHNNVNLHILAGQQADALPTINTLLYMITVWLAAAWGAKWTWCNHTPVSDNLAYIYMVVSSCSLLYISIYLLIDLQLVLGCCVMWMYEVFEVWCGMMGRMGLWDTATPADQ